MKKELEYCEELASALKALGEVRLAYVTAELQPFSNQFRPDLILIPAAGGRKGQTVFIEVKLSSSNGLVDTLSEKMQFASEYLEKSISKFILISNIHADDLVSEKLKRKGFILLSPSASVVEDVKMISDILNS